MTTFIETLNHSGDHFLKFAWPVLWQSSLLIAVIFVLEFALRRKVRAAIRYALWLMVLVKLLLPPSLALPTSPSWWIHPSVPPSAKAPPVSFTVSYGEQVAPDFPLPPAPVIPPPKEPAMSFAAWALAASGVVSAGLLAWLLVRWRQINQKVRRAKTSEKLISVLDEARRLTRLRPGIRLKLTEDSMSPAVCGLFRPVILLPQSLVEKLSAGQLRAVLLHEAIHLRRGDVWVNCAQALLQIVYWWHPLLWLANARIRRVREEAVDDAVMLALRDDAEIYAPTLLEVAKLAFNRPLASLGLVGILESRSALRQRIERLVNFNAPRKAGLTVVSISGILAFSAVALPMGEAPEKTTAPTLPSFSGDSNQTNSRVTTADNHSNGDDAQSKATRVFQINQPLKAGELKKHLLDAGVKIPPTVFVYTDAGTFVMRGSEEQLALVERAVQKLNGFSPKADIGLPVPNPSITNNDVHTSSGREAVYLKLNSIRLESVPWSGGVPLNEALRFLHEQSTLHDPDKKGIQFLFNPNVDAGMTATNAAPETVDPNTINVKLVMDDASLQDVLVAVVTVADRPIRYTVEDYAVVISPKPSGPGPPTFEMRVFRINTNTFFAAMRNTNGRPVTLETNSVSAMVRSFFSAIGVDLAAPSRTIAFNDKLGLLFVKATPSELDTIEHVIQALNQVDPQIHIKARFIEVPKDGFVIPQLSSNVVAGQMTGILSDPEFRTVLQALEHRQGVEMLAEPECVTTSGRQTMMRATDVEEILTNFAFQVSSSNTTDVVAQSGKFEIGPTVDLVPHVYDDGYTINLTAIASMREFLGYDSATNRIYTTNNIGRISSAPTVRPGFRVQQAKAVMNLWDNQTLVLGNLKSDFLGGDGQIRDESQFFRDVEKKKGTTDKEILVFITAIIVDPAGNRVHSDDEMRQIQAKTKSYAPTQPR